MFDRVLRLVALGVLGSVVLLALATPIRAAGQPLLYLPTPSGETWEVIQGYNCGTHDGWGRMSFDIVNRDGPTRGAPVYAAADGTVFFWTGVSGSLLLDHGDGFYTMYSHMQTHIDAPVGTFIARGTQIGTVGSVSPTPTVPHLHFTFFGGAGRYADERWPLPLRFAEGYDFPDEGTCNDHAGALLVAEGDPDTSAPAIEWGGSEPETWLAEGRVDWVVSDDRAVRGFSQAWDAEPEGDEPQFADASEGFFELEEPGVHTVFVRAWDEAGNEAVFSRELWFDPIAPTAPAPLPASATTVVSGTAAIAASWQPASDEDSGVSGYQVYFGADPKGTDKWFVEEPAIDAGPQAPGRYYLRARAQDVAGNFSDWATLATYDVK